MDLKIGAIKGTAEIDSHTSRRLRAAKKTKCGVARFGATNQPTFPRKTLVIVPRCIIAVAPNYTMGSRLYLFVILSVQITKKCNCSRSLFLFFMIPIRVFSRVPILVE